MMTKSEPTGARRAGKAGQRRVRGWKLWLFRLIAVTVVPAAFFLLLEGALRIVGFGYPTSFFVRSSLRDESITNVRFGWRFFPKRIARSPLTFSISHDKPDNTFRIFTLGGSASLGFPDPAYNYGRILEVMLESACPQTDFQVLNVSMTAINSHVVRAIAQECAEYEPDLFIVYLGNNEVVGPYGPGTVFEGFSPSLTAIHASLRVKSTRTGQLIERALSAIASTQSGEPSTWGGMSMFLKHQVPADDPRLESVYASFQSNLRDICDAAIDAGAPVLLCTVASNLRDNPPFASVHAKSLSENQLEDWGALVEAGASFVDDEKFAEALRRFDAAAQIDGQFAQLQFRRGQCLEALGRLDEARDAYTNARDLDALRFRADTQLNSIAREVASAYDDSQVALVDVVRGFESPDLSRDGIPGHELFYEHVHLSFPGSHALASLVFNEAIKHLPASVTAGASLNPQPLSIDACDEALALTEWDRFTIARDVNAIMDQPPFTNQIGFEANKAERATRLAETEQALTPEVKARAVATYQAAIDTRPDDLVLRDKYGHLLAQSGDAPRAIEQWEFVVEHLPEQYSAQNSLGLSLVSAGRFDDAIQHYKTAIQLKPDYADSHNNLGMALFARQDIDGAIREYEQAIEIEPDLARAHYNLAIALSAQGNEDASISSYRDAIKANPEFAPARNNLATSLLRDGKTDEAIEQLEKAVEIDPRYVSARRNLGIAYQVAGQLDKAVQQFEAVLLLAPGDEIATRRLNQTLQMKMQQMQSGSSGGHPGG